MKKKLAWILGFAGALLLALFAGFFLYVNDYYHEDPMVEDYMGTLDNVDTKEISEGFFLDGPGQGQALIFYPGGKVACRAYLPLCHKIAEKGIDCFLLEMPCNLAILDTDKADRVLETYNYPAWIIGGHSLGGVAAAMYAADHTDAVQGLVLLAAYPTKALGEDQQVLELYGSEDQVINREKLLQGDACLPDTAVKEEIPGGNHAGFGCYGPQKGDGQARVSGEEQQEITADRIDAIFNGSD